jgi:hypothetical protein
MGLFFVNVDVGKKLRNLIKKAEEYIFVKDTIKQKYGGKKENINLCGVGP